MSYDLMVFDPKAAPPDRDGFMDWYRAQGEWSEDHGYLDPAVSSEILRSWFLDMIEDYPALTGPYASDDVDDPKVTDYSVGREVIYAAFAWSEAEDAHRRMFELAKTHQVGFFDVSSRAGEVWTPDSNGDYAVVHKG